MKFPQGCILQFAKAPEPGRVKTRLIPSIGARQAAALHRQLTERTLKLCTAAELAPVKLWVDGQCGDNDFVTAMIRNYPMSLHKQQGADLGRRIAHAVDVVLAKYEFVIIVGSDCPMLDRPYLEQAAQRLATAKQRDGCTLVIGPAEDGGYVLIGLTQPQPSLFSGIDWGTERVLEQTLTRAKGLNMHVQQLPVLWDVDREQDLERLAALDSDFASYQKYPG